MSTISTTRLYGGSIAIVSGLYSIGSSSGPSMAPMSDIVMLVLGVVVLVHGLVLLTPVAERIGGVSGPLMIVWSALMLANQALAGATMGGSGMGNGAMRGGAMERDAGMVAIAVLMLVSGAIMTWRRSADGEM